MPAELLVKGVDGKWYISRGGKLVLRDTAIKSDAPVKQSVITAPQPVKKLQPKPAVKTTPAPVAARLEARPAPQKVALLAPNVVEKPAPSAPHMDAPDGMEQVIAEAVTASKLSFPDPSLTKRFKLLVASRLREVRRADDVVALLTRETKVGGLGLSEDEAHRVAAVVESAFTEFHKKWQQVEADRKAAVAKAREEAAKKTQEVMSGVGEVRPEQKELKPSLPVAASPQTVEPFKKSKPIASAAIAPKQPRPPAARPSLPQVAASGKIPSAPPAVTDIRRPKLFGPADELHEMRLVDVRRAGTANEAINRVKGKIDLIGSESLARRRDAINAWRQSEVYTLYTDMMSAAISRGASIDTEISERAKSGKPSLTIDEIDAIMGLNEALRQ